MMQVVCVKNKASGDESSLTLKDSTTVKSLKYQIAHTNGWKSMLIDINGLICVT